MQFIIIIIYNSTDWIALLTTLNAIVYDGKINTISPPLEIAQLSCISDVPWQVIWYLVYSHT